MGQVIQIKYQMESFFFRRNIENNLKYGYGNEWNLKVGGNGINSRNYSTLLFNNFY